jgi:hypothetical protein
MGCELRAPMRNVCVFFLERLLTFGAGGLMLLSSEYGTAVFDDLLCRGAMKMVAGDREWLPAMPTSIGKYSLCF